MNERIGIEFLSVFDLPPVKYVELVAKLGCRSLSVGLTPMGCGVHDYPPFSLREDETLRSDMMKAMSDSDVSIALGEGFAIKPDFDVKDHAGDLDIMCELGARRINSYCLEPDLKRAFDQLATLAEMAGEKGLESTIEFVPGVPIGDLHTTLAALDHVARDNCRLLVDTMHWFRSGATVEDLAAIDPAHIGYVQLCDVPLKSSMSYMEEAMFERKMPGEGELPLAETLAVLPKDIPISLEIPRRALAQSGVTPFDAMLPCVEATEQLLLRL